MSKISRRTFLGSVTAINALMFSTLKGCNIPVSNNSHFDKYRAHPLAGIPREKITISDVRVTLLSYETPVDKQWIPSWEPPIYVWWKTDSILVEVFTNEGIIGIGGASRYGGGIEETKKHIEEIIKPLLIGRNPFDMELLAYRGPLPLRRAAWAGVVAAFWDIIGKATNMPVYKLLATDNKPQPYVPTYASSGEVYSDSVWPDDLIKEALMHKEKGYKAFKFRPGIYWKHSKMTVDKFTTYLEKLRAAVGPDFDLIFEANGLLTLDQALELAPALEDLKFLWLEKPMPETGEDAVDNYLKINEALPNVKVSGLEKELKRDKIMDWLDRKVIDIVQPDCSIAGITESWYIARMANIRDMLFCPHNYQGGLTTMQNAHLAAGNSNLLLLEICECFDPLKEEVFKEPLVFRDGFIELSDKPGFGLEIIDNIEQKFPYIPGHYQRLRKQ
jgi:L-alanine-DL-glutamate epimerase-like enolase superfamily enzyme